ncbi:EKC/KEOPS complex subunit BUD32 [Spathaspora sp. JA1]|nr:EKC/KEOPS complex subunit BUD32 [Spathaspora sp. JA1]
MTERLIEVVQQHLPNIEVNIISQGAEALVFETSTHPYIKTSDDDCKYIIKYRPPKPYRHPKIDASITKIRTVGEARIMYKLSKLGIPAPTLISSDFNNGIIWMEYLGYNLPNGNISSFKNWLWYLEEEGKRQQNNLGEGEDLSICVSEEVKQVCNKVGELIGRIHLNDIVHGDLTSSNIILLPENNQPALIDFGLSSISGFPEDKAVDLYVLERAILSTHSLFSNTYNAWLLQGYKDIYHSTEFKQGSKKYQETIKRLEDVRLRGRKRSMLG